MGLAAADVGRGGFFLGVGFLDSETGDIDAELRGQRLYFGRGPHEYGRYEAIRSAFDRAQQGDVGERPDNGGCDGGQTFVTVNEFMENVKVGRVA